MTTTTVRTGTIQTRIPSRLDRLPWSRFHRMIVVGLGTAWILDGLEVTMVGSVAARLTEPGSGIAMDAADIGLAGAIYVLGACLGALFFGQLCDRFGRRKLFIITLVIYIVSTVVTAFSFAPWFFFLARFFTGSGIGGEYAAVNSAIDELMPARIRGRVDLIINGSFWLGSIAGSCTALFFLSGLFPTDLGWRLAFGVGAVIGLAVMFVRRNVPESPRWLFIHGRQDEAERIVDGIEHDIESQTGQTLTKVDKSIKVRQRKTIPFREIAKVAFKVYPKRSFLCLALFVGQAFIYNGITFNLGTLMTTFFAVGAAVVPVFLIIYAAGNFAGPLVLGRLFDTIGRKPMIAGTYIGSAVLAVLLAILFFSGVLNSISFIIVVVAVFFLASAGASAAYLTASEIFPMETRALAIAFFYAIGTAVGGISGPLLFGKLIATDDKGAVAVAFLIGAVVMAIGGIVELFFGVKAEGQQLEDIAKPLTADDDTDGSGDDQADAASPERSAAGRERAEADEQRARAAEHRAAAHDELALAAAGDQLAEQRAGTEWLLADLAELAALAHDERAAGHGELADAAAADDPHLALAARERARAAEERARAHDEDAEARYPGQEADSERHRALAAAALEHARSREQKAMAEELRARGPAQGDGSPGADPRDDGPKDHAGRTTGSKDEAPKANTADDHPAEADLARADLHDLWAAMHTQYARAHESLAAGDLAGQSAASTAADVLAEQARAAEERLEAARQRADARAERQDENAADENARRQRAAADRRIAEERARARINHRMELGRAGLRRFRPGPGRVSGSPGFGVSTPIPAPVLETEIASIANALDQHGATERHDLARMVGARYWGPGVFRDALRDAEADGIVRRTSHTTYVATDGNAGERTGDGQS